ncbi:MFS general substrate transporter [Daldinia loculata]|uniref:MFS general substrate transporter n=1 Tax=Daldinia loculata TaxID=103429 RepID=UPI0020C2FB05|nr:MFS general substrate transporter [Daldinia loculata]KAI1645918.1 MFS general substrate transporter [Daldinia loculata]
MASPGPMVEISNPKMSLPATPKPPVNYRKTLPPLPPPSPLHLPSYLGGKTEGSNINRASTISSTLESLLTVLGGNGRDGRLSLGIPSMGKRPPRPISKDPRPKTAATAVTTDTALSYSTTGSKRTIKYGTGKHANVELSPRPSEDPNDPLNWPLWKKHLNLAALLSMVALVGTMKTAYISVNSVIAMGEWVSYTAAVALTAVPLMMSAITGLASLTISRIWGKRPVYLISMVMIFIGTAWNTRVRGDLAQNMAARIFQGLGWGAFDTLVLGSIHDTYFEHERQSKIILHHAISVATMLGSPLLGGVASAGPRGFELQFEIMSAFLTFSILLLVLGAPETAYNRAILDVEVPTIERSQSLWPNMTYTKEAVMKYITKMKPWSYQANEINLALILQAPRAIIAPTTALLFAVTLLPYAGYWSLLHSLSMLFSPLPFMLSSASIGSLMTAPFLLATPIAVVLAFPSFLKRFSRTVHLATLALGTTFASIGMLGFGLYLSGSMEMPTDSSTMPFNMPWSFGLDRVSLPVVSFLLGLLAAGSLALDSTFWPVIQRSTAFTSANLTVCLRNTADMHGSLTCFRNIVAGALILGLPNAVFSWDDLKSATLGLGIAQIILTIAVCGVYWYWDENVRRLDGRIMGLIDLSLLKETASVFETDHEVA